MINLSFLKEMKSKKGFKISFALQIFFLLGFLFSIEKPLYADWQSDIADLIKRGQYDAASKRLEAELKKNPENSVPLWMAQGEIFVRQQKWSRARDIFDKVLEKDANNLAAHYYLGICFREIGKFQAFFLRLSQWEKARKHFEKVISLDPNFKDVYYQYALLDRLNKKYRKAIQKAIHQIKIKPNLEDAYIGLFSIYQSYLLHGNPDEVEEWLQSDSSEFSNYFLGEFYRQHKKFTVADSIFQRLQMSNGLLRKTPINLSLVRLKVAKNAGLDAEAIYWNTVESIQDSIDARFLFEDIKYLLTNRELETYRGLRTPGQWKDFYRKFWVKRDPLPAMADNLRLVEHYRRLVYAEDNYRYDGFRSWNANPDQQEFLDFPKAFYLNHEFNDKGLIYIRHGEPSEKSTALGEGLAYNESWLYRPGAGFKKLIFHFEIDEDGLAGDWRLTPLPKDTAALEPLVMWDPAYNRYLRGNEYTRGEIANEIARQNKRNVEIAMSSDRHTWHEKVEYLPVHFAVSNFRLSRYRDLCQVDLSFPVKNLLKKLKPKSSLPVNIGVAIHDMDWNEVAKDDKTISLAVSDSKIFDGEFIESYQFKLAPKSYHLAFHVDPLTSPKLGGSKMVVGIPYFQRNKLTCSDILLAHQIKPIQPAAPISRDNLRIVPNPSHQFKLTNPVYVYLEIYNLKKNNRGQTSYDVIVTVKGMSEKKTGGFLGLFGGKKAQSLSVTSERQGHRSQEIEWVSLDVSHLPSGSKKLNVRVKDNVSGEEDFVETTLTLTK